MTGSGWYALALDAIDGHTPRLPWDPAELAAALATYAEVAAALAEPPGDLVALGLPRLADLARDDILWWGEVAAGREPLPAAAADVPLAELVALESRLPGYADAAPGLAHGDLRVDNLLLDADGRAWLCDWTWLCHGPAWFDLAGLLLTGYASGLDADTAFARHPATAGAPADALDVSLAALAGYFLTGRRRRPVHRLPPPTLPPAVERHPGPHLAHRPPRLGPGEKEGPLLNVSGREGAPSHPADRCVREAFWLVRERPGSLTIRAAMTHARRARKLTNPSYQDEAVAWRTSSPSNQAQPAEREAPAA